MQVVDRLYKGKDLEMLLSLLVLTESLITHQRLLVVKRPAWSGPFFANLKERVVGIARNYLGIPDLLQLKNSILAVKVDQATVLGMLSKFNMQTKSCYQSQGERKLEVLKTLGLSDYYQLANKSKEVDVLIKLLYQFEGAMTADLQTEMVSLGMIQQQIDGLLSYVARLRKTGVTMEVFTAEAREITPNTVVALNNIYQEVMSFCETAETIIKSQQILKNDFSYSKIFKRFSTMPSQKNKALGGFEEEVVIEEEDE
ncbi:MAG: hypothetical protein JNM36_07110 [Chitinophagales bacterium]|jgi:hypothetical protein|nr:hypothetical protein [Chitinophagales bacterium]